MTIGQVISLIKAFGGSGGGGSSGGALIVNVVNGTLDKTAGEIMAAIERGVIIKIDDSEQGFTVIKYHPIVEYSHTGTFSFATYYSEYSAADEADYPVATD